MRERGKGNVEGGEEDDLCVICQSTPVNAVQVSECSADARMNCVMRVCADYVQLTRALPI